MLELLTWSDALSVGNDRIDRQHKALISLCNKAARFDKAGIPSANEEFHSVLNDLAVLADLHFIAEEELLEINHSPFLVEHRADHETSRERLTELLVKGTTGHLDVDGMIQLVSRWVSHHKPNMDMRDSAYMKEPC
jgi:hemerythrin